MAKDDKDVAGLLEVRISEEGVVVTTHADDCKVTQVAQALEKAGVALNSAEGKALLAQAANAAHHGNGSLKKGWSAGWGNGNWPGNPAWRDKYDTVQ